MKFKLSLSFIFTLLIVNLNAQQGGSVMQGEVTFVTSRNVYVKFDNTTDIQIGDTLMLAKNGSACLQVASKSSSSVVSRLINACEVQKGDGISFRLKQKAPSKEEEQREVEIPDLIQAPAAPEPEEVEEEEPLYKERIRGRISLSSFSNIASNRDNRNRFMGRLSLDAKHINNSKLSLEGYLNFRQINAVNPENFAPPTSFFRVFNLAATYEVRPDLRLTVGRKINPKIASLGAIDGLQAEKHFGKAYVGAIVGSRPDIVNFSFNPNLLEYGGYAGIQTQEKNFYSQTTLGLIEQRNKGMTDRRYAYFQHSSTIARNLSLFSSLELDLYSAVNGVQTNNTRLTNLFLSGTYRFGRKVSLTLSYDSRRRVLFFETFQTDIERLLNDDIARQGIRARINIRPIKYLSFGASYAQRFQSDQQNQSDNIHAYASWSRIPVISGRIYFAYNNNQSNYLKSDILSLRHSRSLIRNKLDADIYYRRVNYVFVNSTRRRPQDYIGANLSLNINKKLAFRIAGEVTNFNQETNYRVYARIIRRFYGRKQTK